MKSHLKSEPIRGARIDIKAVLFEINTTKFSAYAEYQWGGSAAAAGFSLQR